MTSYISADLRRQVQMRANDLCEYCLIHEDDTVFGCQVDHIVSEKHQGETEADNLCYACAICNRSKGTDIGSIAPSTGDYVRFYNPRTDRWGDHFDLNEAQIVPKTTIGEATAKTLGFSGSERIQEREALRSVGRYPPAEAAKLFGI